MAYRGVEVLGNELREKIGRVLRHVARLHHHRVATGNRPGQRDLAVRERGGRKGVKLERGRGE